MTTTTMTTSALAFVATGEALQLEAVTTRQTLSDYRREIGIARATVANDTLASFERDRAARTLARLEREYSAVCWQASATRWDLP